MRFLIWFWWLILVGLRRTHASSDSAYAPEELRCAPENPPPTLGGQAAVLISWKRDTHLRPSYYRGRAQIPTHFWLLLLAGDVERNPGPVRYPCTVCGKAVRSNQRGIFCDGCDQWTHAKCCRIDISEYERLGANPKEEWLCPECVSVELPFADVSLCGNVRDSRGSAKDPPFAGASCLDTSGMHSPQTSSSSVLVECKTSAIVCHLNAQSLLPKLDEIRTTLAEVKRPVILGVSETWLDSSVSDGEVAIQPFTLYRRDRGNRGGGVLVYVPESCYSRRRGDLEKDDIEAIWVEVHLQKSTILLCNIYRPPNSAVTVFDSFSEMLESASSEGKEVVVMGDMNCNLLVSNPIVNRLIQIMEENNLTQILSDPTRITPHSQTLSTLWLTSIPLFHRWYCCLYRK